jgi:hypothetical protein
MALNMSTQSSDNLFNKIGLGNDCDNHDVFSNDNHIASDFDSDYRSIAIIGITIPHIRLLPLSNSSVSIIVG